MIVDLRLSKIIGNICHKASEAIMHYYTRDADDWDIEIKSDNSPVTLADKASNNIICTSLRTHFPSIPIISEEELDPKVVAKYPKGWYWIVDPLDGTREFIKSNGEFAINIALVRNGKPQFGMIWLPITSEGYVALLNLGIYHITIQYNESQLTPFGIKKSTQKKLKVLTSISHIDKSTSQHLSELPEHTKVSVGASLKYVYLLLNKAHYYPRMSKLKIWDTIAGHFLVQTAGGRIVNADNHGPIDYVDHNLWTPPFKVYAPNVAYEF